MAASPITLRVYRDGSWQILSLPKMCINGEWVSVSIYKHISGAWSSTEDLAKITTDDDRPLTTEDERTLLCYM